MHKFLLSALLFCVSSFVIAADTYRIEVRDVLAEETYVFEGCELGHHSLTPGEYEASYFYPTCPAAPTLKYHAPGAQSLPTSEYEEVALWIGSTLHFERGDCYNVSILQSSLGNEIVIECGDMHVNAFIDGFEIIGDF